MAELRHAWTGPDFERLAQGWEREASPLLTDVSSALSTMATALRAQAEQQRQSSGNIGGPSIAEGPDGRPRSLSPDGPPGGGGGASSWGPEDNGSDTRSSPFLSGHTVGAERSLASLKGKGDSYEYEVSAGKIEAEADYSLGVDLDRNLEASAGVSAAAYAGYASGGVQAGNGFAKVGASSKAYVGAEAVADVGASAGPDGVEAELGAGAFAGGKAEAVVGGKVAALTAIAGAEVSYGLGAEARVDAELSTTEIGLSADLGVAVGIGTGVRFDVSVDPQEVVANVYHAAEDLW
jgi:hypothetical protein